MKALHVDIRDFACISKGIKQYIYGFDLPAIMKNEEFVIINGSEAIMVQCIKGTEPIRLSNESVDDAVLVVIFEIKGENND